MTRVDKSPYVGSVSTYGCGSVRKADRCNRKVPVEVHTRGCTWLPGGCTMRARLGLDVRYHEYSWSTYIQARVKQ